MSIRTWLLIAAIGLIFAGSSSVDSEPYEPDAKANAVQDQTTDQPSVDSEIFVGSAPTHIASEQHNQGTAGNPNDHPPEDSHLVYGDGWAQWAMAITGVSALILSTWAVVLLKKTLAATDKTLGEAERATEAAFKAVDVTREIGRAQTMAYVGAEWAEVWSNGLYSNVAVGFINSGQTPALWINIYATHRVFDNRGEIPVVVFDRTHKGTVFGPLHGGGDIALAPCDRDVNESILAVENGHGSTTIQIAGRVRYATVFNEVCETEFVYHANTTNLTTEKIPVKMFRSPEIVRTYNMIGKLDESGIWQHLTPFP